MAAKVSSEICAEVLVVVPLFPCRNYGEAGLVSEARVQPKFTLNPGRRTLSPSSWFSLPRNAWFCGAVLIDELRPSNLVHPSLNAGLEIESNERPWFVQSL
jgi:hypothetical protein